MDGGLEWYEFCKNDPEWPNVLVMEPIHRESEEDANSRIDLDIPDPQLLLRVKEVYASVMSKSIVWQTRP